jgi:hypothetical protein
VIDLCAAFDPAYSRECTAAIEGLIDEINELTPGASHRTNT